MKDLTIVVPVLVVVLLGGCSSNSVAGGPGDSGGSNADGSGGGAPANGDDGGAGASGPGQSDVCREYLACMAVAAPNNVAGALPAYGPNGSCWAPDAGLAATCNTACINGLAQLKKLAPGAPECNGAPATGNPTATLTLNLRDGATHSPAKGITAAALGHSAVSAANGSVVLTVPASTLVSPTFIGPGFVNSTFQELTLSGDTALGSVNLLSTDDFHLLTQALPGYDTMKGVIAVDIVTPSGGCNPGGTVSVSPPGATVMYMRHGLPDGSAIALDPAESPAAIIYNASPGVAVTLSVSQSGCHAASPMTIGNATLSGRVTAQAGDAVSLAQLILN